MNIKDLEDKLASIEGFETFGDESVLFILILGMFILGFLLMLLKISFNSMKKIDQKKLDQFIESSERLK